MPRLHLPARRLGGAAVGIFFVPVLLAFAVPIGAAPREPLAAIGGSEHPGAAREWGRVAVGRRADLLLVGDSVDGGGSIGRIRAVAADRTAADTVPLRSSLWLARLPDGEEKRQFILDCTGCHQFDGRIAAPDGRPRTKDEWTAAIIRMLGYAGPNTNFPVISVHADPERTAAWLARHLATPPESDRRAPAAPRGPKADVREFMFPVAQDLPHDVAIDSAGDIVVTGMFSHAMHVLDPETAAWRQVPIPVAQANPRAVEIGRDGAWWVVLGGPNKLARYDGEWQTFDVGVYAHSVALDSNGGAWANGHFSRAPEVIVEIDAAGTRRDYELPAHPTLATQPGGPIPYELRTGPDGAVWMSELQGNRMVRLDPMNGNAKAWELPTPASGPRRHDVAPDGIVWIPAYAGGMLVRFDPRSEKFEEIPLPMKDALPYVVRVDAKRDRVWVGTGAADELYAYRPSSHEWETYPLPSRGALVRHMAIDHGSGDVWLAYGESPGKLAARIARVRVD